MATRKEISTRAKRSLSAIRGASCKVAQELALKLAKESAVWNAKHLTCKYNRPGKCSDKEREDLAYMQQATGRDSNAAMAEVNKKCSREAVRKYTKKQAEVLSQTYLKVYDTYKK